MVLSSYELGELFKITTQFYYFKASTGNCIYKASTEPMNLVTHAAYFPSHSQVSHLLEINFSDHRSPCSHHHDIQELIN